MEPTPHAERSPRRRPRARSRRFAALAAALGGLLGGVVATATPVLPVPVASAQELGAGGEYHPLTPKRIYDSRPGLAVGEPAPGAKAVTTGGSTFDIQLLGAGGVPADPAAVLAVVVNIVVVDATSNGWLNAYGAGAPAGLAAVLNFGPGQTVPNSTIVRPGADGKLTIKLAAGTGSAHVVVDVFGWFSTSNAQVSGGARLIPVTPGRILDTRNGTNRAGGNAPLQAREFHTVPIRGVDAVDPTVTDIVPNDGQVVGVVLNMAGVNDLPTSQATHLSVIPDPLPTGESPATANLNLARGQVKSNMVIVPVGTDGNIRVYNNSATTHVVLDVVGYLIAGRDPATRAGRVVPLSAPFRTFDTRESQWNGTTLGPGQAEDWSFAEFANSVSIGGVSVGAQAGVIGNLTAAGLERQYSTVAAASFITSYPSPASGQPEGRPTAANLNVVERQINQNLVILKYGDAAKARIYNYAGRLHYVYDATAVILADG